MQIVKKAICILLSIMAVCMLCSCSSSDKVFSSKGMSITLTDEFKENKEYYGMTYYDSEEAQVYVAKEEIAVLEEKGEETDFDLKGYADYLLKSISVTAEIKTEDGITYFEYSKKPDDIKYNYFVSVYKTEEAFWFIQFSCQSDKINEYRPLFAKWAKSVFFD